MVVAVLIWVALAGGLIPMSWFLLRFRPSWPPRSPAFIVSGLVLAVWLGYFRIAAVLALRGGIPQPSSVLDAFLSVGPLAVIDVMVIALLVSFNRFRAAWQDEMRKQADNTEGE